MCTIMVWVVEFQGQLLRPDICGCGVRVEWECRCEEEGSSAGGQLWQVLIRIKARQCPRPLFAERRADKEIQNPRC